MKYTIVYLLKGKAKNYHRSLVNEISSKFKIKNLNRNIDSHLTLKIPFRTNKIKELEKILAKFSKTQKNSKIDLKRISYFHKRVIYMKAEFSKQSEKAYKLFLKELKKISWLKWRKDDKNLRKLGRFHATLGFARNDRQFKNIWNYLKKKKFNFEQSFDSISILKKPGKRWQTYKTFKFKK